MKKILLILPLVVSSIIAMETDNIEIIEHLDVNRLQEYKDLAIRAAKEEERALGVSETDQRSKKDSDWTLAILRSHEERLVWRVFAQANGKLIGMVGAERMWAPQTPMSHLVTITGMYVAPEYRRKKVATRMVKTLLTKLKNNSTVGQIILTVTATQKGAIDLYRKLGFDITGVIEKAVKFEGTYYNMFLMGLHGRYAFNELLEN